VRTAAIAFFVALAAGCSNTNTVVSVGSGVPPVPPVNSIISGPSGLTITTTSAATALALGLTIGMLDYATNPRQFPDPRSLLSTSPPPAPEMAQSRRISEQDCSKPVDLSLGNLRCK